VKYRLSNRKNKKSLIFYFTKIQRNLSSWFRYNKKTIKNCDIDINKINKEIEIKNKKQQGGNIFNKIDDKEILNSKCLINKIILWFINWFAFLLGWTSVWFYCFSFSCLCFINYYCIYFIIRYWCIFNLWI